jgi:hypothetical protein
VQVQGVFTGGASVFPRMRTVGTCGTRWLGWWSPVDGGCSGRKPFPLTLEDIPPTDETEDGLAPDAVVASADPAGQLT